MDEHRRSRINLVFRPQGSHQAYPRHDVEPSVALEDAIARFFAEVLNMSALPNALRATLRRNPNDSGALLDITKSPSELGLASGDQISLSWSTSNGGAGLGRSLALSSGARRHKRPTLAVPSEIVQQTLESLRDAGERGVEGICYWVAALHDSSWPIVSVISPVCHASAFRVDVSAEENQRIEESLVTGTAVVAQVHSHLGEAFHSDRDDRHSYSFEPGFLSLVVPWGARQGLRWPDDIAVYELVKYPTWRRLSRGEVSRCMVMNR